MKDGNKFKIYNIGFFNRTCPIPWEWLYGSIQNKVKRITFTISDQEVKDEKNWQIGDHQSSECYLYKKETIAYNLIG